eukprot:3027040-Pleurochrysis_carterae.AAC.2
MPSQPLATEVCRRCEGVPAVSPVASAVDASIPASPRAPDATSHSFWNVSIIAGEGTLIIEDSRLKAGTRFPPMQLWDVIADMLEGKWGD